jgi:hypothetical protein
MSHIQQQCDVSLLSWISIECLHDTLREVLGRRTWIRTMQGERASGFIDLANNGPRLLKRCRFLCELERFGSRAAQAQRGWNAAVTPARSGIGHQPAVLACEGDDLFPRVLQSLAKECRRDVEHRRCFGSL